ncbi:alpha/beta hydrolase [Sphaerisporangium sp. NPDC051011]|uniref:alpha/beta hydrolase n=1 Tax=Sphaerisporangium sp. NPDC051011 TaxID=3155792 RepID=UPI00340B55C0
MLYGTSYGAFLAMLAAAADPAGWSRCVAVSPFVSGPRLHADGSAPIRSLLERLDGCAEVVDELGPRDLLLLAPRIRVPVLLAHGTRDEVIPVGHSRLLARRLSSAGSVYREVPDAGHSPLNERGGSALLAEMADFLLTGDPAEPGHDRPHTDPL